MIDEENKPLKLDIFPDTQHEQSDSLSAASSTIAVLLSVAAHDPSHSVSGSSSITVSATSSTALHGNTSSSMFSGSVFGSADTSQPIANVPALVVSPPPAGAPVNKQLIGDRP